ncbi:response regulator [Bradyrhizobium sp. 176]|uniref:response regulator n=1 Tax=unclassified Bradyrhizobium TaxID=2631580 RepID=UPI0031F6344F
MNDPVRILVVEDESAIQQFVEEALTDGGFEAEITQSGEEALSRFRDGRSGYRALLTDIGIGAGPNGWVLARRIREIDPDLPVVYMTGGHAEEWKSQGVPNSIPHRKAVRTGTTGHRDLAASEHGLVAGLNGRWHPRQRPSEQRDDGDDGKARHGHAPA